MTQCKQTTILCLHSEKDVNKLMKLKFIEIGKFIKNYDSIYTDYNISSIINSELPNYFMNKIDDMNIMLGHQQLEVINNMFRILKGKNREEKIENLKKTNMQKCISWCEKMNLFDND